MHIYIWQRMITPHMVGLAIGLASNHDLKITYVAEEKMSADRANQGWQTPSLGDVDVEFAPTELHAKDIAFNVSSDSIHICQGIRANGVIGSAQRVLSKRGLNQWIIMETIDDSELGGFFKRSLYQYLFWSKRNQFRGILAVGHETKKWIISRGVKESKVYPFAYFLSDSIISNLESKNSKKIFQFIFVGRLVKLKCVDLLIRALASLKGYDFELVVIGDGPCKESLYRDANNLLPGKVKWLGQISMMEVHQKIAKAHCLVLPSRYDGWGATVSEALMAGTPSICSSACGSSEVVKYSDKGGVFQSGNIEDLTYNLENVLKAGALCLDDRINLARWAKCLGGNSGANYLLEIFSWVDNNKLKPEAPWIKTLLKSL